LGVKERHAAQLSRPVEPDPAQAGRACPASCRTRTPRPTWSPNTDVYEGPDGLIVKVELAGVTNDALEVRLEEQALVISGVRRDPQCSETASGYRFRQLEMEYGPFQRILPLPFAVDGAATRATFQNGILMVRLPRSPSPQPTHIRIRLNS
jgi:HSP20 family protein